MSVNGNNRGGADAVGSTALVPRSGQESAISFVQFSPQAPFDDRLLFWEERDSATAAAFRLLRQRLIDRGDPRIVLCTSATRGEGKTTLAANLALAFAELGKHRVLLLETSLRGPAMCEVFGFKPPKGFAGQLAQHRARPGDPWIVVQIVNSPLYILAVEPRFCAGCSNLVVVDAAFCGMCGAKVETPAGALDAVAFTAAIRQFRQSFDYLILDTPSVLDSGDVNLIQDAADAIVFATRRGRSAARSLRRAIEQVAPAPVAAVALMDD
jgi:Mrp family chromosome partitioning ATPase